MVWSECQAQPPGHKSVGLPRALTALAVVPAGQTLLSTGQGSVPFQGWGLAATAAGRIRQRAREEQLAAALPLGSGLRGLGHLRLTHHNRLLHVLIRLFTRVTESL